MSWLAGSRLPVVPEKYQSTKAVKLEARMTKAQRFIVISFLLLRSLIFVPSSGYPQSASSRIKSQLPEHIPQSQIELASSQVVKRGAKASSRGGKGLN
jgi:hypothetical protein